TDGRDMDRRHVRRQVGVTFVRPDDEAARLRDGELATCHPRVGIQYQRPGRLPLGLREIMDVVVLRFGAQRLGEDLGHVSPQLMHCWDHDMAWIFIVELLDSLAKIGLDDLDADTLEIGWEPAFLGQHRLRLDERFRAMIGKDAVDDTVMLRTILSPMNMDAVGL